jgi:hypothetical protein
MDLKTDITLESLKGKTGNEKLQLLNIKYQTPRYIKPSQFKSGSQDPGEAIDTVDWIYVKPRFINNEYTGEWIYNSGILFNNELIFELLNNTEPLEPATIPTNGGRRRAQRKTKVKSKKRANKRRTRTRSRK